jgi:hypothetical protein
MVPVRRTAFAAGRVHAHGALLRASSRGLPVFHLRTTSTRAAVAPIDRQHDASGNNGLGRVGPSHRMARRGYETVFKGSSSGGERQKRCLNWEVRRGESGRRESNQGSHGGNVPAGTNRQFDACLRRDGWHGLWADLGCSGRCRPLHPCPPVESDAAQQSCSRSEKLSLDWLATPLRWGLPTCRDREECS